MLKSEIKEKQEQNEAKIFFYMSIPKQSNEQNHSNDRLTFEFMLIQTTTFCYSNLWRVNASVCTVIHTMMVVE